MAKQTGVKKLSNGRFRARYFAGFDGNGKRQYPSRVFRTQADAIKWRSEQVSEKRPGQVQSQDQTVAEYLDLWLRIKKQSLRENSWNMYQQSLNTYVKPALGHIRLTRLSAEHIEGMLTDVLTRVSGSTAASARTILNGAMKRAAKMGLIRVNPVTNTEGPKRNKSRRYPLTVEEALRFIEACATSRWGLYFRLALDTGIRPEEGIGLQWANLKLGERGVLQVNRVVHRLKGGGWRWHDPKSKNGIRPIVFPGETAARLTEHRKAQLEQKLKIGKHWKNNDLVFCTGRGEPIRHCALDKEFKRILQRAGLPKEIRMYDLRHAFVTFSLIAGVDPKTVSGDAGHSKVSFTLTHYGNVLDEMREAASDKREALMKSRRGGN